MYKAHKDIKEEQGLILKKGNCYVLRKDISCDAGVFYRGTIVHVLEVHEIGNTTKYSLFGDGSEDIFRMKESSTSRQELEDSFEFCEPYTSACNEVCHKYDTARIKVKKYSTIITGILVCLCGLSVFAMAICVITKHSVAALLSLIVAIVAMSMAMYMYLVHSAKAFERLNVRERADIENVLLIKAKDSI